MEESSLISSELWNETNESMTKNNDGFVEPLENTLDKESKSIDNKENNLLRVDEYLDPKENCLVGDDEHAEPKDNSSAENEYIELQRSSFSADDGLYLEPVGSSLRRDYGVTDVQINCTNTNSEEPGENTDVVYLEPNRGDFETNIEYEDVEFEIQDDRSQTDCNPEKNTTNADCKHAESNFEKYTELADDFDQDLIYDDLIENEQNLSIKQKKVSKRMVIYLLSLFITIVLTSIMTYVVTAFGKPSSCLDKNCGTGSCYINSENKPVCVYPDGSTVYSYKNGDIFRVSEIRTYCNSTWTKYDKWCYKVYTNKKTWFQSRDFCRSMGTDLVSIHDENETKFLIQEFKLQEKMYWIGLRGLMTNKVISWSDGTIFSYTNWGENAPKNLNGHERCVQLHPKNSGKWNDNNCYMSLNFICKYNTTSLCESGSWIYYNSSCYLLQHHNTAGKQHFANWTEAVKNCCHTGAHLVKIESQLEYNFLLSQVTKLTAEFLWIGLRANEGNEHYLWNDGALSSFQSWNMGEPNQLNGKCVAFSTVYGNWVIRNCTEESEYICEKEFDKL